MMLMMAACVPSPQERAQSAEALAAAKGWRAETSHAGAFAQRVFAPMPHREELLTLYIEGDGLAWISHDRPSSDPTPINPVALHMALAQPDGAAAYIARPCQYRREDESCEQEWWTNKRFAQEVIDSTDAVVGQLKQRFGASKLILVGYSGGGAVAALVAAKRKDVVRLVTVAGNLDTKAWTQAKSLAPLTGSLNPAQYAPALSGLSQLHFVGVDDKTVPPLVAESFAARFAPGPRPAIRYMTGYDHSCCWAKNWPALWAEVKNNY